MLEGYLCGGEMWMLEDEFWRGELVIMLET